MSVERGFWMRWRVRLGYPVAVLYWLLAAPAPRWIIIGGLVAALGLIVRAAAAGFLRKSQELATDGPYARTRNPLYFGSSLIAAGFALAGHSWRAGILIIAYFGIVYYFVMRNEEAELRERFGALFETYTVHVPLFFPRFTDWRASHPGAQPPSETRPFSWARYRRNREWRATIGTVAALVLVWLRMCVPAWLPWFPR
jgi:protein-S-isoprenylcysteine O-methyltransferase Ste14